MSMIEIPYAADMVAIAPCVARILMRNGEWLVPEQDRPADWRRRMNSHDDVPQPRKDLNPYPQRSERLGIQRCKKKPKASKGRGKAYNRIARVSDEEIIALRNQGLTWSAIGKRLDIDGSTAYYRLKRNGAAIRARGTEKQ